MSHGTIIKGRYRNFFSNLHENNGRGDRGGGGAGAVGEYDGGGERQAHWQADGMPCLGHVVHMYADLFWRVHLVVVKCSGNLKREMPVGVAKVIWGFAG